MKDSLHGTRSGYKVHKCKCDACRAWGRADTAARYARHAEKRRAVSREYRLANPEKTRVAQQQWVEANRDRRRAYARARYRAKGEVIREQVRKWRALNPDKVLESSRAAGRKRRMQLDAVAAEFVQVLRRDPCSYCGETATEIDHIFPVSAGGTGQWDNLTSACRSCNASKGTASLLLYLTRRKEVLV